MTSVRQDYPEYDDQAAHQLANERERRAMESLLGCLEAGASPVMLNALATELGLRGEWEKYKADHLTTTRTRTCPT